MSYKALGISVRKTPYGKGVFATRTHRKASTVGQMKGRIGSIEELDEDYVVDLGDWGVLEPRAPFRFLNHSCDPNAELIEYEDDDPKIMPTMWVETTRTIRKNEQLTIDYGWPAEVAIPCLCGAANCRGWIVAKRELPKLRRLNARRQFPQKRRA